MSAAALPSQRSMDGVRKTLATHGWAIVADHSGMRPTTMGGRNPKMRHHGRITAEKTVTFGMVRVVASWENGRFVEALVGRDGYARAYIVPTIGRLKELLADPGCGFIEIPAGNVVIQGVA